MSRKQNIYSLQLGLLLLGQQVGHQHVADLKGGFVEVEAHALTAESLGDNVELKTENRISNVAMLTQKGRD